MIKTDNINEDYKKFKLNKELKFTNENINENINENSNLIRLIKLKKIGR